jgi:hypothetical protein
MSSLIGIVRRIVIAGWLAIALPVALAPAEDWPTYQHDAARSGITSEKLPLPLVESWAFQPRHAPEPAWGSPKAEAVEGILEMRRIHFDDALQVAVADGRVYFGSSADGKVWCLDASTGQVLWTKIAGRYRLPVVSAFGLLLAAPVTAADARGKKKDEGVFDPAPVHRYSLEIPEEGLAVLRKDRKEENRRTYVRATFREYDVVMRDVGVHLKGGAGSFRQLGDKPAFTIKFDHFVPGQKYRGLQKLSLNNAVQDPTYLSDLLGNELFRAAGVPAPRIGHARLALNGKDQGFYVVLEAITSDFLRRSFGDSTGNLYKGPGDVDGDLFVDPQSPSTNRADIKALTATAAEPDRNKRRERMAAVLDLDRFASFLALETINWHWDGYSVGQNNFDIYHDPVSDRLVFFPHDQDQLFGEPGGSIYPQPRGLVAQAFRSTPWGGKLYRERLATLRAKLLDPDAVAKRLEDLAKKINPIITEIDAEQGKAHREAVARFIERIRERSKSIREQLDRPEPEPPKALAFEGRKARTSGWESRTTLGQPRFARSDSGGQEGGSALRISAPEKDAWCGSFRTSVILPPGRYRFGGLMKTKGVEPLAEGGDGTHEPSGAALRISGKQPSRKLLGDRDWTWVEFDFEVEATEGEGDSAVGSADLVCELRASRGTVWFDEGSLEVIRVYNQKE